MMYSSVLLIIVFFLTGDLWYCVKPVGGEVCKCYDTKGYDVFWPARCLRFSINPIGFRCKCVWNSQRNVCIGIAEPCRPNEYCPGKNYCDCNESSLWSKGLYDVVGVDYDELKADIHNLQPKVLAIKEVPNHTSIVQSGTLVYEEKVTKVSSYRYTSGIQLDFGTKFKAGIPFLAETEFSIDISPSYSHTWGEDESEQKMIQGRFTCSSAPYKLTECSATMRTAIMDVPYVMQLKHKNIPGCVCESRGVWKGTQVLRAKLRAKPIGNCRDGPCDKQ